MRWSQIEPGYVVGRLSDGTAIGLHVPAGGGYVRWYNPRTGQIGGQGCRGLMATGPTLEASPGNLLQVARREWRRLCRTVGTAADAEREIVLAFRA